MFNSVLFGYDFIYRPIPTPYELYQKALIEDAQKLAQDIINYQQKVLQQCYHGLQSGQIKADVVTYEHIMSHMQPYLTCAFVYGLVRLFMQHGLDINQIVSFGDIPYLKNIV